MMQRRSPPKHRHDGTSPLPLGMDWSPPPRKWNGRQTVWPHDPRTGWSYCITIPSWVVLPKSRDSDPVVEPLPAASFFAFDIVKGQFYRVQVGLQSPEGITTARGVLRRFNDFLTLFANLKKAFPRKDLPPAPPKGLLRMKSRALLEERRCSLEEWMTKLLSDIEISRSVTIASFLELEAAARTSFQDENQQSSEANPATDSTASSLPNTHHSSCSLVAGSSSVASDYGSDTACETSELGTPWLGRDENFEIGVQDLSLDDDLTSPIEKLVKFGVSNIDEGLFMGQTILDQLEGLPKHKPQARYVNHVSTKDKYNGSKALFLANDGMNHFSETEPNKGFVHARKLSSESVGSDGSSLRGSEMSNSAILNSFCDGSIDIPGVGELLSTSEGNADMKFSGDVQIILPSDQRHRMSRVLQAMQRRLVTAKTDMEDLIARLNQEIAVKDYLATKVQDLEVELETAKQKNKENLQQAILVERERLTKMQWDMEELRLKSMEMELKLSSKEDEKLRTGLEVGSSNQDSDLTLQELDSTRKQLGDMSKRYQELEAKSRADIKYLAKEFKSLKNSETELKQELNRSLKEKSDIEKLLKEEREMRQCEEDTRKKLLRDCRVLCNQLQDCNHDLSMENDDPMDSSQEDVSRLLTTCDDQVADLLMKVQLFADEDKTTASEHHTRATDDDLRKTIVDIFTGNAKLRKQVNSVIRCAFQMGIMSRSNGEATASKINHVER